jgi:hypothetical protein
MPLCIHGDDMITASPDSPYKFLDAYEYHDHDIFFGREPETEILLADVVVQRLVVLFARTGTGKTSLINAGVRPRLNERGYQTYHIRLKLDPTDPNTLEFQSEPPLPNGQIGTLKAVLANLVGGNHPPVVLFFDQFEEFFLYVYKRDAQPQSHVGRQFITDVAELYDNKESGVHFIFSMREEFFVEMDAFREEIPNIFHNDSNLRLLWFEREQAEKAIILPARAPLQRRV